MAKVKDLLCIPVLKDIKILAGKSGLDRPVEHVTVMEVPDIKRWLKGNDFLITSFYSVRKGVEEQCRLIEELADTCCCVAVKTGSYVDKISKEVMQKADECSLPLLEIPFHLSYIDILINVMDQIFREENTSSILEKYVKDILYDNYTDEILMAERGRLFGFDIDSSCFVAVNICFRKRYTPTEQEKKTQRFLCQTLHHKLQEDPKISGCYLVTLDKGFLLLLEGKQEEELECKLDQYICDEELSESWRKEKNVLMCGTGTIKRGLQGIRDSYSIAFKAMNVGSVLYRDRMIYKYKDLQMFCELEQVLCSAQENVFTDILKSVHNKELTETLYVYYECGNSMELAAQKMYTHKKTIKYRLNRIQELTGMDMKRPDDNFRLYLAFLAHKFIEGK